MLIKRFIILTFILIFLDQIVKALVFIFFYEPHVHIDFIDGVLALCPFLNTQSVFLASIAGLLDFDISNRTIYTMFIIIFALLYIGFILFLTSYFTFISNSINKKPINALCCFSSFAVAGAVCSLIDSLFWGGSLDFIMLFNSIIFDFKDAYIWISGVLAILYIVQLTQSVIKLSKNERKSIPGFFKWIKMKCPITPQSAV